MKFDICTNNKKIWNLMIRFSKYVLCPKIKHIANCDLWNIKWNTKVIQMICISK